MNAVRAAELVQAFKGRRVLVVGDLMLDEFVWGTVSRISPEAPIPVVEVTRESCYPGGAANVARNLRPFCASVHTLGLLGADAHGAQLRSILAAEDLALDCLMEDPDYATIVKTRIIARQQQVVRVDREKPATLSEAQIQSAVASVKRLLPSLDAIIIEDYGKGFLTQSLVSEILEAAVQQGKIVTVDPNPCNPLDWTGATTVKPNRVEAFATVGLSVTPSIHPASSDQSLIRVGTRLLAQWGVPQLLVTLGEEGMMLFRSDAHPYHTPTQAQEVFDVSGAGDTAIALYTLALCAGATPEEAAEISNHASGVVVGKLGTATLTPEELVESFHG